MHIHRYTCVYMCIYIYIYIRIHIYIHTYVYEYRDSEPGRPPSLRRREPSEPSSTRLLGAISTIIISIAVIMMLS